MKKLYAPIDESELVVLRSMLESAGIPYYVQNENFGSLFSGVFLKNLNAKTIMVPEEYFETANEIISNFKEES